MKYTYIGSPEPQVWVIEHVLVEHKGTEYDCWVEYDRRMGETAYGFKVEPPEDFDYDTFSDDLEQMVRDYNNFCEEHELEPEAPEMGEL